MQICIITSEFYPNNTGGIGLSILGLANALIRRGHKIIVLTRGSFFKERKRAYKGIVVFELPFIPFPPPLHLIYHGYFLNKKLEFLENRKKIDIIELSTPLVPNINSRIKKVVKVHSLWIEEVKHFEKTMNLYSLAVNFFKKSLITAESIILKKADSIIVYSEHERQLLKNYNLDEKKILKAVIANGLIDSKFGNDYGKVKGKVEKKFDLIFVGRLNLRKGIKEFMTVISMVIEKKHNLQVLIIGEGPHLKWIKNKIKQERQQKNVLVLGKVNYSRLPKYLKESKIFVSCSRYEPFGRTTGEAMACGLPVIGTKVTGTMQLVKEGITGYLVDSGNNQEMADKIVDLLNDENMRKIMGKEGKIRINKYFNENVIAKNHEDIYKDVLKKDI